MAHLTHTLLPLRGEIGGLVFRHVRGKILVSTVPVSTKQPSVKQQTQRARFAQACAYAKTQMQDEGRRADYEAVAFLRNMPNAYNVAIADYFNAPTVHDIKLLNNKLVIEAEDDFAVHRVLVELFDMHEQLLQQGEAIMQINRRTWVYTIEGVQPKGVMLCCVTASDLPGNRTRLDKEFEFADE
jgi:hypothetical protein